MITLHFPWFIKCTDPYIKDIIQWNDEFSIRNFIPNTENQPFLQNVYDWVKHNPEMDFRLVYFFYNPENTPIPHANKIHEAFKQFETDILEAIKYDNEYGPDNFKTIYIKDLFDKNPAIYKEYLAEAVLDSKLSFGALQNETVKLLIQKYGFCEDDKIVTLEFDITQDVLGESLWDIPESQDIKLAMTDCRYHTAMTCKDGWEIEPWIYYCRGKNHYLFHDVIENFSKELQGFNEHNEPMNLDFPMLWGLRSAFRENYGYSREGHIFYENDQAYDLMFNSIHHPKFTEFWSKSLGEVLEQGNLINY